MNKRCNNKDCIYYKTCLIDNFSRDKKCTGKLSIKNPAHPRKAQNGQTGLDKSDISGSANITNLADYVMIVQRIKDEEDATKDKHTILTIDKDRYMGNRLGIELLFDKDRRRFYCLNGNGEELEVNYLLEEFEQIEGEWIWED